jgi:hypothetical protein
MFRAITTVCVISQILGCASYMDRPSITDRIPENSGSDEYIQFLTRPDRRVVLVNVRKGEGSFVCAEPSPDVAENVSSSLQAALAASHSTDDKVNGSVAYAIEKSADKLFSRSQGVQLYRDGMFYLCLAYMNKAIDRQQFATSSAQLLSSAEKLIDAEMPVLLANVTHQAQGDPTGSNGHPATHQSLIAPRQRHRLNQAPRIPLVNWEICYLAGH